MPHQHTVAQCLRTTASYHLLMNGTVPCAILEFFLLSLFLLKENEFFKPKLFMALRFFLLSSWIKDNLEKTTPNWLPESQSILYL